MSSSIAREKREEYLEIHGEEYNPESFVSPKAIFDAELRKLVSSLKVADAHARMMTIKYKIDSLKQGGVAILSDDQMPLVHEFENLKQVIAEWEPFTK